MLTGPCGSGKTDLVHAVARQSECTVLEINTTDRRGGAALKNVIAEATQSDSLQMLHQKTQIAADEEPLQDSDDDEETSTKAAPLILVLVDEGEKCHVFSPHCVFICSIAAHFPPSFFQQSTLCLRTKATQDSGQP